METASQPRRRRVPITIVLWAVFLAFALFVQRVIGCPLAGCGNATVALLAGIVLAIGLAAVFTHASGRPRAST